MRKKISIFACTLIFCVYLHQILTNPLKTMEKKSNIEIINTEAFASSIRLTADFKINGISFFASGDYIQGNSELEFVEVFRLDDLKYFDEGTEEFEIGEELLCQIDIIKDLTI